MSTVPPTANEETLEPGFLSGLRGACCPVVSSSSECPWPLIPTALHFVGGTHMLSAATLSGCHRRLCSKPSLSQLSRSAQATAGPEPSPKASTSVSRCPTPKSCLLSFTPGSASWLPPLPVPWAGCFRLALASGAQLFYASVVLCA